MKVNLFQFFLVFSFLASCAQGKDVINVVITPEIEYQTIHNFGASDAWSAQFIGNWPLEKKNKIADLLFSLEFDKNNSPKGIGLSAWRFNIGAGSAEQGIKSKIKDEWRRAEGFLSNDGIYNWKKQSGQQWFLQEAKKYDVSCLIGFVNSPPVQLTKNNKAFSTDGLSSNLKEENYYKYALFLKDVVNHFKDSLGIAFNCISPFNEPQWEWKDGNQEGSPWDNRELAKATRIIDSVFTAHEIASKIEISEAGAIDYLTSEKDNYINRSNQIEEFFNSNSKNYIGDLKGLSTKFAGHSYFSTWDVSVLKSKREKIAEKLGKYPNLEYWMTEYCVLENNEIINGQGKDLGINTALYVARLIHADLTIANASAWHWWLALSPYDYKDGLICHDKYKTDGSFQTSKMLWALGNYSRFIRPEAKRIKVDYQDYNSDDNLKNGVLISAYKNKDNSMVMVIVNQKKKDIKIDFNVFDKKYNIPFSIYRTDHNLDLREISNTKPYSEIELPQKSISTLVFK